MKDYYSAYIGLIGLALTILLIALFCDKGVKPKTLPHYRTDTTYVEPYHVDSTGKYLIRWNGDTVKITVKPIKE